LITLAGTFHTNADKSEPLNYKMSAELTAYRQCNLVLKSRELESGIYLFRYL